MAVTHVCCITWPVSRDNFEGHAGLKTHRNIKIAGPTSQLHVSICCQHSKTCKGFICQSTPSIASLWPRTCNTGGDCMANVKYFSLWSQESMVVVHGLVSIWCQGICSHYEGIISWLEAAIVMSPEHNLLDGCNAYAELPTPQPILQEHYRNFSGTSIKFQGLFSR